MTWLDALAWTSGGLVTVSGLPNVIRNLRATGPARPSPLRDALQLAGNLGWAAYGLLTGLLPLVIFCALNAAFMALLIVQQARRAMPAVALPHRIIRKELNHVHS
jgi:hypothetical protein